MKKWILAVTLTAIQLMTCYSCAETLELEAKLVSFSKAEFHQINTDEFHGSGLFPTATFSLSLPETKKDKTIVIVFHGGFGPEETFKSHEQILKVVKKRKNKNKEFLIGLPKDFVEGQATTIDIKYVTKLLKKS